MGFWRWLMAKHHQHDWWRFTGTDGRTIWRCRICGKVEID